MLSRFHLISFLTHFICRSLSLLFFLPLRLFVFVFAHSSFHFSTFSKSNVYRYPQFLFSLLTLICVSCLAFISFLSSALPLNLHSLSDRDSPLPSFISLLISSPSSFTCYSLSLCSLASSIFPLVSFLCFLHSSPFLVFIPSAKWFLFILVISPNLPFVFISAR